MALVHASGFNAFLPAATGQIISYIRDPKNYKLNQYTQLFNSPEPIGVYYKLSTDDVVRVPSLEEDVWADGQSRKVGDTEGMRFDTVEFQCIRRNRKCTIGWQALKSGQRNGLNILLANTKLVQNRLMVARTARVISLLETSGNWGVNTGSASSLGGDFWGNGTESNPVVKAALLQVAQQVHQATNGMVADLSDEEDVGLILILSPDAAATLAVSPEIHSYLARSPFALAQLQGGKKGQNAVWGLPDYLYGFKLVIETAVRVSEREQADGTALATLNGTRDWVKDGNSAVVCSRPGGLDGQVGAPSFSTAQIYFHNKEMALETFDDTEDELTRVHCQENVKEVLAAPQSGFLITHLFS